MVPLDLVKCRIQVNPEKYGGIVNGFRLTVQEGGMKELAKGWAPTAIGYSAQGLCKFGFYEVFKIVYGNAMGEVIRVFFKKKIIFIENEVNDIECKMKIQISLIDTNVIKT